MDEFDEIIKGLGEGHPTVSREMMMEALKDVTFALPMVEALSAEIALAHLQKIVANCKLVAEKMEAGEQDMSTFVEWVEQRGYQFHLMDKAEVEHVADGLQYLLLTLFGDDHTPAGLDNVQEELGVLAEHFNARIDNMVLALRKDGDAGTGD